jgi:hypothetical protein
MFEFRHLVQDVTVTSLGNLEFQLTSRRDFTTLADLAGSYSVEINGRKVSDDCRLDSADLGYYSWKVAFEEGKIEAAAGNVRCALETVGAPAKIEMKNAGYAWDDLVQIELTVTDTMGRRVVCDQSRIRIHIEGEHEYLGMDNGDIEDLNDYRGFRRNTLEGRLMIYLRRTGSEPVTVRAMNQYLGMAQITIG